jgi:hypothetical protein
MMKMKEPSAISRQPSVKKFFGKITCAAILAVALDFSVAAQNAKTDFNAFQVIPNRNIFNPNRYANHPGTYRPRPVNTRRPNTFTLTGTLQYDAGETPGNYAFFDGSNSEFRKVTKPDDTIAGFKIVAVTPDSVTLLLDTNQIVMKIGSTMRQDDQGHWALSDSAATFARNSYPDERGNRRRNVGGRNNFSAQPGEVSPNNADTNGTDIAPPDMTDQAPPPDDGAAPPPDSGATDTVTLPAGPASDALIRLMQQRQQEEQQSGGGAQPPAQP